jgi:IPT/TIG domain
VATLAIPAAAGAAATVGSPLTAAASVATCGTATFTNTAVGGGVVAAPFDGVVVRWRLKLQAAGGSNAYRVRVIHPAGGSNYTGAGTGPGQTAPLAGVNIITLPTPLPVHAGDLIGVDCPSGAPAPFTNSTSSASTMAFFSSPPLADGSTRSPTNSLPGEEELVNADVVGVPAVTSVSPASGAAAGGTTVTISGSRLSEVTGVTFGGVPASAVTPISDGQVQATAPAHAAGPADVQVINAAGTSSVVPGDTFAYQAPLPVAPVLTSLTQSHRAWRAGKKLASVAKKSAPVGTVFSLSVDEQTTIAFAFTQKIAGRKVNGRCVATTRKNRSRPGCKRTVTRGKLSMSGHAGTDKVTFQGRISRSKALRAGRYMVTVTATNAAGQLSAAKALSFTIVK